MASLDQEMAVREHDLGWHHGKSLTRRCRDCSRIAQTARRAAGLHRRERWVQDELPVAS